MTTPNAMSAEVRDDNPYSRLMALERMGVVEDYQRIRFKSVAIIGCGGVGSVVAEMLTRCGIGKLILFDYDRVELANMNRLFYRPEQQGLTKVEAAKATLHAINPEVEITCCHYNITLCNEYERFVRALTVEGGIRTGGAVDLLLCCVDNFSARLVVNQVCLEHNLPWMESGVSENAVSGHIQLLLPGVTPCYQCAPPLVVATGQEEAKRVGVCAASLPTTMGIIAGFLSHNCLKYLLDFGVVSEYIGYDSLKDHFPSLVLRPNPECTNVVCLERQAAHRKRISELDGDERRAHPLFGKERQPKRSTKPRAENSWGISVEADAPKCDESTVTPGFHRQYEDSTQRAPVAEEHFVVTQGESVDELMKRLKMASSP